MRIFAVSGFSKTGKTTTIAAITKELTARGLSVGIIKDSRCEGLTLDTAGKDTENTDKVTDGTDKDAENTDKTENTDKETAQA